MTYPIYSTKFTASNNSTLTITGRKTSDTTTDSAIDVIHTWPDEDSSTTESSAFIFDDAEQAMNFALSILDVVTKTNPELLEDITTLLKVYKPHTL